MAYASESQKERYLPKLASGEEIWCRFFPNLMGAQTWLASEHARKMVMTGSMARRRTSAQHSDYGILITRTDPDVPKHKGLTMFFLDMRSPGIDIRPIKQFNGDSGFNEVYFDDVRIQMIGLGEVGDGWRVSLTTLMNERLAIGGGNATGFPKSRSWSMNCGWLQATRLMIPQLGQNWLTGTLKRRIKNTAGELFQHYQKAKYLDRKTVSENWLLR